MCTIDSRSLYRAIGVTSGRIEQLFQRGIIEIKDKPGRGRSRRWTKKEALDLLLLCDLMELGVDAREAAKHIRGWVLFADQDAFLVLSTGKLWEVIPTTERGAATAEQGEGRAVHKPGCIQSDIVKKSDLSAFLSDRRRHAAAVINLQARAEAVDAIWRERYE